MLRKPTSEEVDRYLDRAYELALDPTLSGYPTYIDGIKTKADFENVVRCGLREERDYQIFLYEENGKVSGLICFYNISDDNYLQTVIFNIEGDVQSALAEFEAYCHKKFTGYELYLGFPKDNQKAVEYFGENGWNLLEHSYNDVLHFTDYQTVETDMPVVKVTHENFDDFRKIHEAVQGDMYWNSDRLYEDIDAWNIWMYYQHGKPHAAVYYTNEKILMEIFGVDFIDGKFDKCAFQCMVRKVLNDCKANGCKHMVFFNDEESQNSSLELGFECVGEYLLFVKKV